MSREWRELMTHAVREADRLDLEFCLHNCAGWSSSGGPWVTPEHSMFEIVWTEQSVESRTWRNQIERPPARLDFYRDICVLAFPTPLAEGEGGPGFRLEQWRGKAGFERLDAPSRDQRTPPPESTIPRDAIIDLTSKLSATGTLDWTAPEGNWTLLRIGYTPTLRTNHPAPEEGRGLECDKLSKEGADQHWRGIVQKVLDDAGNLAGPALNNVLIDSYETGQQNWTHDFPEQFRRRRGYDPTFYLPAVTGRVVDDVAVTERFLWDFRRTIADLFCENYYGRFAALCHERGLRLSIEPYGGWTGNFHDLEVASQADIPMGEFWTDRRNDWCDWSVKLAASAAHAAGTSLVGAEAFTSAPSEARWLNHPGKLKAQGDWAFSQGLTRVIFHTCVHQPWPDAIQPGMTMSEYGMQLNRNNTWFRDSRAWMDYLARCQYLLQQGEFVADLCYVASENAPNRMRRADELHPAPPAGYDYDMISTQAMLRMRVERGRVVLPSGMSYQILVLPNETQMRPRVLRKVVQLAEQGATIIGPQPTASPSLEDYPDCDDNIQTQAAKSWSDGTIRSGSDALAEALQTLQVRPDFELNSPTASRPFAVIHRRTDNRDVYFVSNQARRSIRAECVFRQHGAEPELLKPQTGECETAAFWRRTEDDRTAITLRLGIGESIFVVFSRDASPRPHVIAAVGPADEFTRTPLRPNVEVKRAVYGVLDGDVAQQVDVTDPVRKLVANSQEDAVAGNSLAGDPAYGRLKELRIEYTEEGIDNSVTIAEGDTIYFPAAGEAELGPPPAEFQITDNDLNLISFRPGAYEAAVPSVGRVDLQIAELPDPIAVEGPWQVRLIPQVSSERSHALAIELQQLCSLSDCDDDRLRYFAGKATYAVRFDVPNEVIRPGYVQCLDLGGVEVIAKPHLNGENLGTLWHAPYQVNVTGALRPGENELTIDVTTLWPNRLIGDERLSGRAAERSRGLRDQILSAWVSEGRLPESRESYSIWRHWLASDELQPAGLLGPVRIYIGQVVPVLASSSMSATHE